MVRLCDHIANGWGHLRALGEHDSNLQTSRVKREPFTMHSGKKSSNESLFRLFVVQVDHSISRFFWLSSLSEVEVSRFWMFGGTLPPFGRSAMVWSISFLNLRSRTVGINCHSFPRLYCWCCDLSSVQSMCFTMHLMTGLVVPRWSSNSLVNLISRILVKACWWACCLAWRGGATYEASSEAALSAYGGKSGLQTSSREPDSSRAAFEFEEIVRNDPYHALEVAKRDQGWKGAGSLGQVQSWVECHCTRGRFTGLSAHWGAAGTWEAWSRLFGARRSNTLRNWVRAWLRFRSWLVAARNRVWPESSIGLINCIEEAMLDSQSKSLPGELQVALVVLETCGRVSQGERISWDELWLQHPASWRVEVGLEPTPERVHNRIQCPWYHRLNWRCWTMNSLVTKDWFPG